MLIILCCRSTIGHFSFIRCGNTVEFAFFLESIQTLIQNQQIGTLAFDANSNFEIHAHCIWILLVSFAHKCNALTFKNPAQNAFMKFRYNGCRLMANSNPAKRIKIRIFHRARKKKQSNIFRVQLLVHTTEFLLHFACVHPVAMLRLPRLSFFFAAIFARHTLARYWSRVHI